MECRLLTGGEREAAAGVIRANHYTHGVPSGKTHYFGYGDAVVLYSIPANKNVAAYLLGYRSKVWELTRLYAPDGHDRNLLTRAISYSVRKLRTVEPGIDALVSYADPNVGHLGGVYRAASWVYTGQSEDGRYYVDSSGQVVSRRKFHSGSRFLRKAEIEALGYRELKRPGKHRFVRGLTRKAARAIDERWRK